MKPGFCRIRDIPIPEQLRTYCANNHTRNEIPEGPVFGSDLGERRIPWSGGGTPRFNISGVCSVCGVKFEQGLEVESTQADVRRFCGSGHYVRWWEARHPGRMLAWEYGQEGQPQSPRGYPRGSGDCACDLFRTN